jgi:transposase-like protein
MLMLSQGLPDGQIKTAHRGRPAWVAPDLAQVQAAAERGQNMKQIAKSLGVHPATFYRKKQTSPEFNESVGIGREKRAVATTIALYETQVPVSPRELDQRSAILFYFRTHPVWGHRYDTTVKTSVDTPPGGRYPSAEELKLIQAMTAQERLEIDAICERARQRFSHPEAKATTQGSRPEYGNGAAQDAQARGFLATQATRASNSLKPPENAPESLRANADAVAGYKAILKFISSLHLGKSR